MTELRRASIPWGTDMRRPGKPVVIGHRDGLAWPFVSQRAALVWMRGHRRHIDLEHTSWEALEIAFSRALTAGDGVCHFAGLRWIRAEINEQRRAA